MSSKRNRKKTVALQYEPDETPAPVIIARGAGEVAKKIIEIGAENKIPVIEDETMLQLLYPLQPGEYIPESLYKPVAKLLAYVILYKQKKSQHNLV